MTQTIDQRCNLEKEIFTKIFDSDIVKKMDIGKKYYLKEFLKLFSKDYSKYITDNDDKEYPILFAIRSADESISIHHDEPMTCDKNGWRKMSGKELSNCL